MPVLTTPSSLAEAFRIVCICYSRHIIHKPNHKCVFKSGASSKCTYYTYQKGVCTPVSPVRVWSKAG